MGMVQHYPAISRPIEPVCSVCIANYNGMAMLKDCIESVLSQLVDLSVEIIVHDDASTDNSVSWLRGAYPQVEILASPENVGFCISNNRMAAHACGEYILLLNNDAALYPDALSTLVDVSRRQSAPGIFTLPQYDWMSGALVDRGCLLDPFYNPIPNLDPTRIDVAITIGACMFLTRNLWFQLQGFPEWLESIGEDLYLCCLARLSGVTVQVTPGSGYRHRQGVSFGGNRVTSNQLQTTYRRRRLSERNKTSVLFICTPTAMAWPLLAMHLAALTLEGVFMTLARWDPRIWSEIYGSAIKSTFAAMANLRAQRLRVQLERRITLKSYLHNFVWLPQKLRLLLRHGLPSIR